MTYSTDTTFYGVQKSHLLTMTLMRLRRQQVTLTSLEATSSLAGRLRSHLTGPTKIRAAHNQVQLVAQAATVQAQVMITTLEPKTG